MLCQIISAVRQGTVGGIFEFVARLKLFLVGMTVRAEGYRVAQVADLLLLRGIEPVACAEVSSMVERCAPVFMALAAERGYRYIRGMRFRKARCFGAGCGDHRQQKGRRDEAGQRAAIILRRNLLLLQRISRQSCRPV